MNFIKTPTKGMRDILPNEMEIREYLINKICDIYKLYGFKRIETPCVEHIENISNKQGWENEKLVFKILKRGEKLDLENAKSEIDIVDSGLRYDLTVPLTRYYSNNMNELDNPFKSLQIGNVYRADRPQKGRFRQFVQCDIDIIGEKTNMAEIELINATSTFLNEVGLNNYKIVINDRRILKAVALQSGFLESNCDNVFISLDKMDKISIEGVRKDLLDNGNDMEIVNKYLSFFESNNITIDSFCKNIKEEYLDKEVVTNLKEIIDITHNLNNVNIIFDPTLVRGMSYYTGPIFEIKVDGYSGSAGGGGRYDEMINRYIGVSVPACGFSIGFERLVDILMENNFKIDNKKEKYAYILDKNDITNYKDVLKYVSELRSEGKIVNLQYKSKNFKHQKEVLEQNGYIIYLNGEKI